MKKNTIKPTTKYTDLLVDTHRRIKALLNKFDKSQDEQEKQKIAVMAIYELRINTGIEDESVYPALLLR
jgi:hypothetical protein